MSAIQLREGFEGQDMFVIPRPILGQAATHPLVRSAYPTDIGWFPNAAHHFRERANGLTRRLGAAKGLGAGSDEYGVRIDACLIPSRLSAFA